MRIALVLIGLALIGYVFGSALIRGETIRTQGETILLRTAPADPRAFLLGDFMRLRYREEPPREVIGNMPEGVAVLEIDGDGVGTFLRLHDGEALADDERLMRFTAGGRGRDGTYGGERYYFQSGTGERFAGARYGVFKVMPDGRALLSGLADADRRVIAVAGEAPATE